MQCELILLIAPAVPCFRIVVPMTAFVTFMMLVTGYMASLYDGDFFYNQDDIFATLGKGEGWDASLFDAMTRKGMSAFVSTAILLFLSFVQIPVLAFIYICKRRTVDLPPDYLKLLAIVSFTWLGFPIWWCLSFEGLGIIEDTKLNGCGFVVLNICSKGAFTLQVMRMVKQFKAGIGRVQQDDSATPSIRTSVICATLARADSGLHVPGYVTQLAAMEDKGMEDKGPINSQEFVRNVSAQDSVCSESSWRDAKTAELLHDMGLAQVGAVGRAATKGDNGEDWDLEEVPDSVLAAAIAKRLERAKRVVNGLYGFQKEEMEEEDKHNVKMAQMRTQAKRAIDRDDFTEAQQLCSRAAVALVKGERIDFSQEESHDVARRVNLVNELELGMELKI